MTTDTIEAITSTRTPRSTPQDVFADLNAWRISPGEGALVTKELLTTLPVRKATRQEFFMAHPDEGMTLVTNAYEDKDARGEMYIIARSMVPHMHALGVAVPVKLVPAITRQGVLLLLPAKIPNEASANTSWQDSLLIAIERARKKWVRISADMALSAYRIFEAEGALSEPEWPELNLSEMLTIAFKNRIIDTEDHPIYAKLLGRV